MVHHTEHPRLFLGLTMSTKSVLDETATLFLAHDLSPAQAEPDPTELLVLREFPFERVLDMTLRGEIVDSMTMIAVLWADRARRLGSFAD